jgi:hypothetical protein
LLRTTLIRFGDSEHILLLTVHHVVSDGWSMSVLFKELAAFYEAFLRENAGHWRLCRFNTPTLRLAAPVVAGRGAGQPVSFWKKQLGGRCQY